MLNFKTNKKIDANGYLLHPTDWNEEIAIYIAEKEGITLNTMHWEIIYFVRAFYLEFKIPPKIRTLINAVMLKYGEEKGNSIYLAQLFPKKTVMQQITKIAGLPKPIQCL